MAENELSERIYEALTESFRENKEIIAVNMVILGKKINASVKNSFDLEKAILDYTMDISQVICTAMFKLLFKGGILNIHSDEK